MTNTQKDIINNFASFVNNVGKLSIGRSTRLVRTYEDGSKRVLAKVTCDTLGQRPRLFTVSSSGAIPAGSGYTYKKIIKNIFDYTIMC